MPDPLERELQELGLEKNEAAVYLAALVLGPSPVQKIAQRASVPRATTYLVLKALKQKGLVLTHEQGKKVYFTAGHPSQLQSVLERREIVLQHQKHVLKHLISELEQRGQFLNSARPRVRYYEGPDAFNAYRRDLLSKRKEQKLVRSVLDLQSLKRVIGDLESLSLKRAKEGVSSRVLFADPEDLYPIHDDRKVLREGREIVDHETYPIPADVSIIGNSVGLMPYGEPFRAVIIEDADVARSLVSLFELAWKGIESLHQDQSKTTV